MLECVFFACSPRVGGNTDLAARVVTENLAIPVGQWALVRLREYDILPCTACGGCEKTGRCVLAGKDRAEELFCLLQQARRVVFFSPIYFYHVPAQLKSFIDRAQAYYWKNSATVCSSAAQNKPAWAALWGGRKQGDKLFCGAELSLRFFLRVFGFELQPPLTFYGIEKPGEIVADPKHLGKLQALGKELCR